jgi:hypothetical protein
MKPWRPPLIGSWENCPTPYPLVALLPTICVARVILSPEDQHQTLTVNVIVPMITATFFYFRIEAGRCHSGIYLACIDHSSVKTKRWAMPRVLKKIVGWITHQKSRISGSGLSAERENRRSCAGEGKGSFRLIEA